MHQRKGEATLSDLFQRGTKDAQLPFSEGTVLSVCVGKVGHDAFHVKGSSHDMVVEEREQLFRRKPQPTHSCFNLEVDRIGSRLQESGLDQGGKDPAIADDRGQLVSDQFRDLLLKECTEHDDRS